MRTFCHVTSHVVLSARFSIFVLLLTMCVWTEQSGSLVVHKYSTRVVRTKYGPLRGVIVSTHPQVEAFLGVPYATPPLGSLRYMPPVTPSMWRTTRLADRFSAVCPQRLPDIGNRTEALLEHPRSRLLYLEKLLPLLANQSEDCLYMNLYVPRQGGSDEVPSNAAGSNGGSGGAGGATGKNNGGGNSNANTGSSGTSSTSNLLPCIVYVHGESYEWNSGNPYDGTQLAAHAHVIVVTVNFRLGVLGFLKTGTKGSAQGNYGLMDLVAGLHWLRENLPAFGGDPEKITLMGHGTGAAIANFIAVSPVAKELLHRAILLSGSGLSPWALQRDPLSIKRIVAKQTGCHGDLLEDDIAPCLRTKPLHQLLSVHVDPPRFLPGFAPFVDGTVLMNPSNFHSSTNVGPSSQGSAVSTTAGFELADFPDRDLMFSLSSVESYLDLNSQDLLYGFNETRKDRILRTYVRNSYFYHLNEIFSTLKNEYTDWEKPTQSPLSVRDATLEVLSDGHTAAPLIRVGYLHALRGGKTFFLHFHHQSNDQDFPQVRNISGSVRGEDLPYVFGLPLVGGLPFFPHNYSHADQQVSKLLMYYIGNFARKGDPNGASPTASPSEATPKGVLAENGVQQQNAPFWDTYDTINQLYLELGNKAEMKNHYRGHKMSLWLNLIPQLHRPGDDDDVSMRHHHFQEEGAQYYDGTVRAQSMQKPTLIHMIGPPPSSTTFRPTIQSSPTPLPPKSDTALQATTTTECPPNATDIDMSRSINNNNLIRRLQSSHYQSYTTALTVTIAVGCFLLLLNILIFAGIYHQRDRGRNQFGDKKKEELAEAGSCSSSSGEGYDLKSSNPHKYECKAAYELSRHGSFECKSSYSEYAYEKHQIVERQLSELPLQEFKCSPPSGVKRQSEQIIRPPSYTSDVASVSAVSESQMTSSPHCMTSSSHCMTSSSQVTSPTIPEPPPPPKAVAPIPANQSGILRSQAAPVTPGTMKKRVQIQEISV